jgi:hypothetical protein
MWMAACAASSEKQKALLRAPDRAIAMTATPDARFKLGKTLSM